MPKRGTIFFASDFVLDPWLREVKVELADRGLEIIDGPPQQPPTKTHFAPVDWERFFARANVIVTTTKSSDEANQLWHNDLAVWPEAIKRMGITLD